MSEHFDIRAREIDAIAIAYDELVSYLDVVGNEGQLDDEEMPTQKLSWARDTLRDLLDRRARFEALSAEAASHHTVVGCEPVRFAVRPTPPSGPRP